jgi:hypothetical protein
MGGVNNIKKDRRTRNPGQAFFVAPASTFKSKNSEQHYIFNMDLWDVVSNFLIQKVTPNANFRISDLLALGNHLNVQLKPPRNANSGQITFMLRDLLDEVRNQQKYHAFELANDLANFKPFDKLGSQLKDLLLTETISCMNSATQMMAEQRNEIER